MLDWYRHVLRWLSHPEPPPEISEAQARVNTAPLTNAHGEREPLVSVSVQPRSENGDLPERYRR